MNTVFYALVAVLLLGAGAYWWFFMKGQGGKKKVDMTGDASAQSKDAASAGSEQAPVTENAGNMGEGDQNQTSSE